ncbi:MAG: serine hydrolase domain-containing protein, partial [Gemmatimonadaceae bacterium]
MIVRVRSKPLILAAVVILTACATTGRPSMDEIDVLMKRYTGDVPGASLLVVRGENRNIWRSYGLSNLEDRITATSNTNYRLASVTKQFTAAAILLLAEDGKLSLDDRVKKWLPSLPPEVDPVTIEHLLTHTSGIVDYEDVMAPGTTAQLHDADVLRLLESQDSTYFKPGSGYRYSNSGYALLALIVERASGKPFATFLR